LKIKVKKKSFKALLNYQKEKDGRRREGTHRKREEGWITLKWTVICFLIIKPTRSTKFSTLFLD